MLVKQKRRWGLFIAFLLMLPLFSITSSVLITNSAHADYVIASGEECDDKSPPVEKTLNDGAKALVCSGERKSDPAAQVTDEETCAVDKIGWILCPIIEQAAVISDKAFDLLADNFLRTDPQLFDDNSGTRIAWEMARNLANIMFIIAFLIIIISQVTSFGISNYGIKKMMPRLVVAAIAVNVSYFICQIIVDVSNIAGYEIQNALASISDSLGPSVFGDASNYGSSEKGGGFLTVLAVGILASAGVVMLLMAPLGGMIMLAIITVVTIIIILLLRKALIVLLIVVSPIAFVLYLLPNTEKFFSKWLSMFGKILMVFPVVGLLFGAGQLASTIILVSGGQNDQMAKAAKECNPNLKPNEDGTYEDSATQEFYKNRSNSAYNSSDCGAGAITLSTTKSGKAPCQGTAISSGNCQSKTTVSWMLGIVAAGIAIAPLIAVWAVLKGALSAAGAIGGKISSAVSKGVASGGNGAANAYKNSNFGKYRSRKAEERTAAIQAGTYKGSMKNPLNISRRARSGLNNRLNQNSAFNTATGGYGGDRALMAQALNRKDSKEAMDMFSGDDQFMQVWANSNGDMKAAAEWAQNNGVEWNEGRQQKFKQLVGAGHHRKASSYLAAASYLAENGKGNAGDIKAALGRAGKEGASQAEIGDATAYASVAARKSGRVDTYSQLSGKGLQDSFGEVNSASLSHDMFGDPNDPSGGSAQQKLNRSAFYGHLLADKNNTDRALRGFSQMDSRTQRKIEQDLVNAARAHGAVGAKTVQDAKNHFGIQ